MYTLIVRFDLPDTAAAERFDELAAAAVPLIRSDEAGTLTYQPYAVDGEPLARVFFEVYRDREAHGEHERQPHTVEFLSDVRDIVTSIRAESVTAHPGDLQQ